MSGVWVFKYSVYYLVENPQGGEVSPGCTRRRVALMYLSTGEVMSSYSTLEQILMALGCERYYDWNPDFLQYHRESSSIDLILLPWDFSKFNSIYMYDMVMKNPSIFKVRDA